MTSIQRHLPLRNDAPGPRTIGHTNIEDADASGILTPATGFMNAYDYTLNPYSGCSFGCTYCYAAFFSRSPEDRDSWGSWVRVKRDVVGLLLKERKKLLKKAKSLVGLRIYMSTVTDPYQPIERKRKLTRNLLTMLVDWRPKLVVQTRSPDVVRDIDLFKSIVDAGGHVQVNLTVTTDDDDVRRTFEPHCPNNKVRLKAAGKLREANVQTCITMTPLLWVADANGFANQLLDTKVERFIIQGFHFQRGKFVRNTRDAALHLIAQKFGMAQDFASVQLALQGRTPDDPRQRKGLLDLRKLVEDLSKRYGEHYDAAHNALRDRIEQAGLPPPGEGKDGFRPPF